MTVSAFLQDDAYAPLPTLVQAARNLFARHPLPQVKRAAAATDPTVARLTRIVHGAAQTKSRRLVLVTGIPGSGKTLVGLRLVHANFLDDLALARSGGRRVSPAIFLSGNGPLIQVLQDALRGAGGGGRTFVQDVKNYIRGYRQRPSAIPTEHVLVFDEAQRAWDAQQVALKHTTSAPPRSEPEHLIEFAERIPDWCVVVGLIGMDQEIHVGEEGGLMLWQRAVENVPDPARWQIHLPPRFQAFFAKGRGKVVTEPRLDLQTEVRFHHATHVHAFVENVLATDGVEAAASVAKALDHTGYRFWLTRDLEAAKAYVRERYAAMPAARYGLLASSKARDLVGYGIDNTFQTTKRLRVADWYNRPASHPASCCALERVATEFAAQGLELDFALVAWGTDFMRQGSWSIERARGTRRPAQDWFRLRQNAYRVLLTRGRDGAVVYVPPDAELDETYAYLHRAGMPLLQ